MKLLKKKSFYQSVRFAPLGLGITAAVALVLLAGVTFKLVGLVSLSERASLLRQHPGITQLLPVYWSIRKLGDITYLGYALRSNPLPTYSLHIEPENLQTLNESLPDQFSGVVYTNPVYVPATFSADGKTYEVEVRYRGANAVHWNGPKRSYLIKFKSDDLFNNSRRLSFIIPNDRYFALEQFNNYRADKLGLPHPESSFANLVVNGRKHGAYFVIENWSKEMLAKWEMPDETNFYGEEDFGDLEGIVRTDALWDNLDRWEQTVSDNRFSYQQYSELDQLLRLLNDTSDQEFFARVFTLIDKDNFYAWQIHQELANSAHQALGNVRLYFNNTNGKFYFIPWDVEAGLLPNDNAEVYSPLSARIFSNPTFLSEKNQRLYAYLADERNLEDDLAQYDQIYDAIKVAIYQDRRKIYTNRYADSVYQQQREEIAQTFSKLRDAYAASSAFATVDVIDDNQAVFAGQSVVASVDVQAQSLSDLAVLQLEPVLNLENSAPKFSVWHDANRNQALDATDDLVTDLSAIALY